MKTTRENSKSSPIGRKVTSAWHRCSGEIIKWDPLSAAMCDTVIRESDGGETWIAMRNLQPTDGLGPLPDRQSAIDLARAQALVDLEAIRARHVAAFREPWPGCEFAKTIVGRSIDDAIADLQARKAR